MASIAVYQPHPLADLFPMLEGEAYRQLVEDIRKHGVREPVVMLGGKVLDGRNRYLAARECGAAVPTVEYEGDDPLAYVISLNLQRRHLSDSQRGMVAAKIANLPPHRPEAGKFAGIPTQSQAAEMLNVSERTVRSAAAVQEHGTPTLVAEVQAGNVSVSAAAEVATLPEPEQAEIVARGQKVVVAKAKEVRAAKVRKSKPPTRSQDDIREDIATRLLAGETEWHVEYEINQTLPKKERIGPVLVRKIKDQLRAEGRLPDPRAEARAKLRAEIEAELRAEGQADAALTDDTAHLTAQLLRAIHTVVHMPSAQEVAQGLPGFMRHRFCAENARVVAGWFNDFADALEVEIGAGAASGSAPERQHDGAGRPGAVS